MRKKRRDGTDFESKIGSTCGISESRFIQGDRPEAGAKLAMTDRELAHLFLRAALAQLAEGKATGDRFAERRGLGGDCT